MNELAAPRFPILVADDEESVLLGIEDTLASEGLNNVITCRDSREILDILAGREIELLLLDMTMPHLSGRELLPRIRELHPDLPVIVVTGINEVAVAVECMKLGVFDYLVKAVEARKLLASVGRAIEIRELKREVGALSRHLFERTIQQPEHFSEIISADEKMQAIFLYIESIAGGAGTVLVTGETGTGKELIAGAIHRASGRRGELVEVNVAGLDEAMFTDTLFGHVKGSFTGADRPRRGLIESAAGGTLFLDEIGDLCAQSQIRLLRFLESGQYYPLGSDVPRRSDARIVVATNRNLADEMAKERFRKDLYYRLKAHHIHLPPLRERPRDLALLAGRFIEDACREFGKKPDPPPRELFDALAAYGFPGNVRELRAMIFDAVGRHERGELGPECFKELGGASKSGARPAESGQAFHIADRFPTLKEGAESLIRQALERSGGNQTRAARLLGITPQALSQRLKSLEG